MTHMTDPQAANLVRPGDRWLCLGDSITAVNGYPRILERLFHHHHPHVDFQVINSGMHGDVASDDPDKLAERVLRHQPSIVSIMYGMNEAINGWQTGQPAQPVLDDYRRKMTWLARTLQTHGMSVLLLSPTQTDPTCRSYFTLEKTGPFLRQCAEIVREVAAAEGALYIPIQEMFAVYQDGLPGGVSLTSDGVHPAALGQYVIASTLATRCGFDMHLDPSGVRSVVEPAPVLPVRVQLARRFLDDANAGVELLVTTAAAIEVDLLATIGDRRHQETLHFVAGTSRWVLPVPKRLRPMRDGQATDMLVELRRGAERSMHLIDLCRTRVLHLEQDRTEGTLVRERDGRHLADWRIHRQEGSLSLEFEVYVASIYAEHIWPFARDGLNLMFDFRPTERFADIGIDREVTQLFLNVREHPFFSIGVRAWSGLGLDLAATAAGARTSTGYTARLFIHDNFNLHTSVQLDKRDFVGLLIAVAEHEDSSLGITANQCNDHPVNLYANNLMIIDLKRSLAGPYTTNVHLATL